MIYFKSIVSHINFRKIILKGQNLAIKLIVTLGYKLTQ